MARERDRAPQIRTTGLLTISLNCIEMNRRLLVNNDFILHSLLGKSRTKMRNRAKLLGVPI